MAPLWLPLLSVRMRIHKIIRLLVPRIQNLLHWMCKSKNQIRLSGEGKDPSVLCPEHYCPLSSYLGRKFHCNFVEYESVLKIKLPSGFILYVKF